MIAVPLSNTDSIKWPIRSGMIIECVNDVFANEFIEDLRFLRENYPISEWKKAFFNVLSIWKISHHVINGLRKTGKTNEIIAEDILLMCDVINGLSPFEWTNPTRHVILAPNDIDALVEEHLFGKERIHNSSLYTTISSFLWAYSDALFFQGREICCERHGLYNSSYGRKVFITDVRNINEAARYLWPDTYRDLWFDEIRILLAFDNKFEMTIDPYNNTDISAGSFTKSCYECAMILDGQLSSEHEAEMVLKELSKRIGEQTYLVNNLTITELKKKYIEIFWYRKKRLCDYLRKKWEPAVELYDTVNQIDVINNITIRKVMPYAAQVDMYDYSKYLSQ